MNRKLKGRGVVASAGFCIAGVMGIATGSYGGETKVSAEKYEMQIFEGGVDAEKIVAGHFTAAIEQIQLNELGKSKYERSTNLCVALTLQRDFPAAETECYKAKRYSMRSYATLLSMPYTRLSNREKQAIALNNLGVLKALQGDARDARELFESAKKRSRQLESISQRNLVALAQRHEPDIASR